MYSQPVSQTDARTSVSRECYQPVQSMSLSVYLSARSLANYLIIVLTVFHDIVILLLSILHVRAYGARLLATRTFVTNCCSTFVSLLQVILQVPGVTPQAVQQFEIQLKDATGAKVGTEVPDICYRD